MTHQDTETHDRAVLAAAATVAFPAVVSAVLIILYIAEYKATANLVLAGAIILAITAIGIACIQQQRRTRQAVASLREDMGALREDVKAARLDAATVEIAGMMNDKVIPLHHANGNRL